MRAVLEFPRASRMLEICAALDEYHRTDKFFPLAFCSDILRDLTSGELQAHSKIWERRTPWPSA